MQKKLEKSGAASHGSYTLVGETENVCGKTLQKMIIMKCIERHQKELHDRE